MGIGGGWREERKREMMFIIYSSLNNKKKMLMPNLRKFYNLTPENVMALKLQPPKKYLYTT